MRTRGLQVNHLRSEFLACVQQAAGRGEMTFKPDRDKLNANFEGYKLGKQPLLCITQSFDGQVRVARLKEADFSYQHVRAFSLYNHLTADPWDECSVYWCTNNDTILRGTYSVRVAPSTLTEMRTPLLFCWLFVTC